jgi:outer membrane lipoprotein-sorting protein
MEITSVTVNAADAMWAEQTVNGQTQVMKRPAQPEVSPYTSIRDVLGRPGVTAEVKEDEVVEGDNCTVLEINLGEDAGGATMTYWFNESNGLLRRMKSAQVGMGVMTMNMQVVAINQPIDDAKFTYTPPEGTEVIELPE